MPQLNKQLQEATLQYQQEQLKQRIASQTKKMMHLFMRCMDCEEEIKIVEGCG
jgi:hypothetical protein